MESLADLMIGDKALVISINGGGHYYRQRLFAAGIIPGAQLELSQKAPLGDVVKVVVNDGCIALRCKEAAIIKIKKIARDIR